MERAVLLPDVSPSEAAFNEVARENGVTFLTLEETALCVPPCALAHAFCLVALVLLTTACQAELDYGLKDIADQGTFIASSTDAGRSPGVPWLSDSAAESMFGIRFPEPTEVTRVVVRWSEFVPAPGSYYLRRIGDDGQMVALPADNTRALYPLDTSTFAFPRVTVREVLVFTTRSRPGQDNRVGCSKMEVYGPAQSPPVGVRWPRRYFCEFDHNTGALKNVKPDTAWFAWSYAWGPLLPLCHWIGLVADPDGQEVPLTVEAESIKSGSAGSREWISFSGTLQTGTEATRRASVRLVFGPGPGDALGFTCQLRPTPGEKNGGNSHNQCNRPGLAHV